MRKATSVNTNSLRAYADAMNQSSLAVVHPFQKHHEALQTPDGGFSINPLTGAKPTQQYMVALDQAHGGLEESHPFSHITPDLIQQHAAKTQQLYVDPNIFQGGWHDPASGIAYLDASRQFSDPKTAMDFARENRQISVFDLHNGKSIPTQYQPGDQKHASLYFVRSSGIFDDDPLPPDPNEHLWDAYKEKASQGPTRQQLQQNAHQQLKQQGYSGNFEQAARRSYMDHVNEHAINAENATQGWLLNRAGIAKNIDPKHLFNGNPAIANAYASQELREHWQQNPRPDYNSYRESLITGGGAPKKRDFMMAAAPHPMEFAGAHPAVKSVKDAWSIQFNHPQMPLRPANQSLEEAKHYHSAPDASHMPEMQKSYKSLIDNVGKQYNDLRAQGLTFTPHTGEGEPYQNSDHMREDLAKGQLKYLQTANAGELADNHPMRQMINTVDGPKMANDVFRGVHDALGHGFGASFGPLGEQKAWQNHRATLPAEAHPALYTETRGQNVWTNYGPHMQDQQGNLLPKEQQMPVAARPFGEQKQVWAPQYA